MGVKIPGFLIIIIYGNAFHLGFSHMFGETLLGCASAVSFFQPSRYKIGPFDILGDVIAEWGTESHAGWTISGT